MQYDAINGYLINLNLNEIGKFVFYQCAAVCTASQK